jgi:hypothetical protein
MFNSILFIFLADIKHRSSSLDHSQSHRRRLPNRKTVPIRVPYVSSISNIIKRNLFSTSESDDEQIHSPIALIDSNMKQNYKLVS